MQRKGADACWAEYVEKRSTGLPGTFHDDWAFFREILGMRKDDEGPPPVWRPSQNHLCESNLGRFMAEERFESYADLHRWSVDHRELFWEKVIRRLGIRFATEPERILKLDEGVTRPRWLPGAEVNCVDSCFTSNPERIAVISGSEVTETLERVTYGELERLVNRIANGLIETGFGSGEGIALYMPMTLECIAAYLGIIRAGCYVVSVADSFSPSELERRVEIGNARGIVTLDAYIRGGKTIRLYERVIHAGVGRAIVIPQSQSCPPTLRDGDLCWSDFLSENERFESETGDPLRMTNVLFSSGTTGTPKAIPWNHLTPIKCAMDGYFHQDIQPCDAVAWPTNIGWMMGPWLIYASLINDATITLYEGAPTGERFVRFVHDAAITILGVVPSLVRAWRLIPEIESIDWTKIRLFSSTGEPSNQMDYLWLMSLADYRAPVIEYCGGTEIGGGYITGTVVQDASPATFTTPSLGLDLHILDDEGKIAAIGRMGEVFLVPPSIGLSQDLLNADHEEIYHRCCPVGPNGETLRRHGDQMVRLHGGFYKAQGRADDTMNLGGIKVGSLDLERVMNTHEEVHESAAIGVRSEGEGPERLVVYLVARGGVDRAPLRRELEREIASRMNPLFKIDDLVVVDKLPRTATNKLMRRVLRKLYVEEHGRRGKGARE